MRDNFTWIPDIISATRKQFLLEGDSRSSPMFVVPLLAGLVFGTQKVTNFCTFIVGRARTNRGPGYPLKLDVLETPTRNCCGFH